MKNSRISRRTLVVSIFCVSVVAGCLSLNKESERLPANQTVDTETAVAAFKEVHRVATGVRCLNCHVPGDRPMQLEGSSRRMHNMNIQRKITGLGMACATCHQEKNFNKPNMPPGAPHWGMPRGHKALRADMTAKELCELWLDPRRNQFELGPNTDQPRTAEQILEHITDDELVKWTWNPGPGRTPSPGTHAEFVRNVATWVHGGHPCPRD